MQEDAASPLAVLEELTSGDCRQELATKLVKLFLGQGLAGPFLDYLTRREAARTSELPAWPPPGITPQGWVCRRSQREVWGAQVEDRLLCLCVLGQQGLGTPSQLGAWSWVQDLVLLLMCCVTLGSSLNHSGPLYHERSWCGRSPRFLRLKRS